MERVRRVRQAVQESPPIERVRRTRAPDIEEKEDKDFLFAWHTYKESKCLYVGKYLFAIVSQVDSPHHGGLKWVANVQLPGMHGPVAVEKSKGIAMTKAKTRAREWLDGLKEPHVPVDEEKRRRK